MATTKGQRMLFDQEKEVQRNSDSAFQIGSPFISFVIKKERYTKMQSLFSFSAAEAYINKLLSNPKIV